MSKMFDFLENNITSEEFWDSVTSAPIEYKTLAEQVIQAAKKIKAGIFYQECTIYVIPKAVIDMQTPIMMQQSILPMLGAQKMTIEWLGRQCKAMYRFGIYNDGLIINKIFMDQVIITESKISGYCFTDSDTWSFKQTGDIDFCCSTKYKTKAYISTHGIDCSILSQIDDKELKLLPIVLDMLNVKFPFAKVLKDEFENEYKIFPTVKWDILKHCKTKEEALAILNPSYEPELKDYPFVIGSAICRFRKILGDMDVAKILRKMNAKQLYNRLAVCKSQKWIVNCLIHELGYQWYKQDPGDIKSTKPLVLLDQCCELQRPVVKYNTDEELREAINKNLSDLLLKKIPTAYFKGPVFKPSATMQKIAAKSPDIFYVTSRNELKKYIGELMIGSLNEEYVENVYFKPEFYRTEKRERRLKRIWIKFVEGIESGNFVIVFFRFKDNTYSCLIDKRKKVYMVRSSSNQFGQMNFLVNKKERAAVRKFIEDNILIAFKNRNDLKSYYKDLEVNDDD